MFTLSVQLIAFNYSVQHAWCWQAELVSLYFSVQFDMWVHFEACIILTRADAMFTLRTWHGIFQNLESAEISLQNPFYRFIFLVYCLRLTFCVNIMQAVHFIPLVHFMQHDVIKWISNGPKTEHWVFLRPHLIFLVQMILLMWKLEICSRHLV